MQNKIFNKNSCRFESSVNLKGINNPLSVIIQITRRCDLSCVFCSETERMPDATIEDLIKIKNNLKGVSRVYLSGGEPLLRNDLQDILKIFYKDFIIGLPTNALKVDKKSALFIEKYVDFVTVGLDGPRSVTNRVRGDYDGIIKGINILKSKEIPLALCAVVLSSSKKSVPYACQIADVLGAKKIKLILPILKGNALKLPKSEYLNIEEAEKLFRQIKELKKKFDWKVKITMTTWKREVEGYSILVYPNGDTYAWPVYDKKDKVLFLGNLTKESIKSIWQKYPFKLNHLNKYLGRSINIT